MTRQPEQTIGMQRLHVDINRRLNELEARPATIIEPTVDAGGTAWQASNAAWVDPTTITEYSELRVRNTVGGVSELYRCMNNGTANAWVQVA